VVAATERKELNVARQGQQGLEEEELSGSINTAESCFERWLEGDRRQWRSVEVDL